MGEVNKVVMTSPETGPDAPATKQEQKTPDRPAWLPEKFKTPEDLAKSYTELEKKLGGGQKTEPEKKPETETPAKTSDTKIPEVKPPTPEDLTKFSQEFETSGKLSDESYKELQTKFNLPKDIVDAYIEGQKVRRDAASREVFDVVGGPDKYGEMVHWASQSLPKEDVAAYNVTLQTGDMAKIKLAVAGLKSQFDAKAGKDPTLLSGGRGDSVYGYRSTAEMTKAIRDPRYSTDAAYRKDVEAKIAVSKF